MNAQDIRWFLVISLVLITALTTYFSALNLALTRVSRSGLEREFAARGRSVQGIWLLRRTDEAGHAASLLRTIGRVGIYGAVLMMFTGVGEGAHFSVHALVYAALCSIVVIWVVTSVLAAAIARHASYPLITGSLGFIRSSVLLFSPFLAAVMVLDEAVHRLTGANLRDDEGDDELLDSIQDRRQDGDIDPVAATLLENAVSFGALDVSSIMTPRTDIEGMPLTDDIAEIRLFLCDVRHSRVPVFEESLDEIVGILYVRDLVRYFGETPTDFSLRTLLREPLRVPESKLVGELLRDFQRHEVHLAIVVDEYGGTAGICTIEDVLEELVGEIHDEHEDATDVSALILARADGIYETDGRVTVPEVNDRLGLSIPDEGDYATIAGFLLDRFGRVPVVGDRLEAEGAIFVILRATRTAIEKIGIEVQNPGIAR
ncbi:MAG: HlyC/CorC family transporter [Phycisphaerales bacterium]|nr:HlyC/CorC family transporter [Phycisphaerales bacterium]